jgi:HK97 family phage major capsid protein
MIILKDVVAKDEKDLTADEKTFLIENAKELDAEAKAKFAVTLKGDDENGLNVEDVKELVSKSVQEAIAAKADQISTEIVSKFMAGANEQRAKILAGKKVEEKNEKADDKTRKFMKALMSGDRMAAKALSTSESGTSPDDAAAGLLVPKELLTEVLRIKENQYGLARRDMRYLPFSGPGNSRTIPALGTSVQVFWTNEKGAKKSTQPKFGIVTQTLKKLAAIVPFTEEILEDSAINLTGLIAELFAEATAKEEDLQFFAGDGTVWTGILNNGNVNIVYQNVAGVNNLTADDLLKMIDGTPTGALAGAKFYLNRTVLSVVRRLKDLNGQYIYQNPGNGLPATIWNYPYELSDAFPLAADVEVGSPYILFGNLKQCCVFGDKQQLRVKLLEEATIHDTDWTDQSDGTGINLAEQDMVALRVVERVGYVIGLPAGLTVLDAGSSESES